MFQKRRSMLGRRHLMAQQQVPSKPAQPQAAVEGSSSERGDSSSWRGHRSGKKRTPSNLNKSAKDFKKCLFSKSPGVNYMGANRVQSQGKNYHSSNENLLNETGITSIAATPSSTPRNITTPATLQQRRVELEKSRYGPLPSAARLATEPLYELEKPISSSSSRFPTQTSYNRDFDNLKPPDSPGPSRLERILLEEKLAQTSSSNDFYNFKPPNSPGPSRLNKLILEEKLTQPLDPDLIKLQSLRLEDPNPQSQFSPPLSSTCIGSPDSGKKNGTFAEVVKTAVSIGSGRKLGTIKEDCDVSVIEFELNERTLCNLDDTLVEATINNTVKPNNVSRLEQIPENHISKSTEELKPKPSWENILTHLDHMERAVIDRAANNANEMEVLKEQIEKKFEYIQEKIKNESLEDISKIRSLKKTLESLKHSAPVAHSTENKENNCSFKIPTCKKKLKDEESKWFNGMKAENPGLLKTPNPSRKINQSATWTPHSLSKVLHDQMNELYDV